MFFEQLKRHSLVALHERAVADHVREHNRGELAMFGTGAPVPASVIVPEIRPPRVSAKSSATMFAEVTTIGDPTAAAKQDGLQTTSFAASSM